MMPTTMTTMTNPGPIPAHSVPQQQKLEPPKMQPAPTIAHAANQNANVNKSGSFRDFMCVLLARWKVFARGNRSAIDDVADPSMQKAKAKHE